MCEGGTPLFSRGRLGKGSPCEEENEEGLVRSKAVSTSPSILFCMWTVAFYLKKDRASLMKLKHLSSAPLSSPVLQVYGT